MIGTLSDSIFFFASSFVKPLLGLSSMMRQSSGEEEEEESSEVLMRG